ncbi:MAG: hypothetical protein U9Q22_00620, partial [Candidatus Altiarchaeota archaeon]|nr:hypothetical protein [Candidatus Altiarchaeota archaeon]
ELPEMGSETVGIAGYLFKVLKHPWGEIIKIAEVINRPQLTSFLNTPVGRLPPGAGGIHHLTKGEMVGRAEKLTHLSFEFLEEGITAVYILIMEHIVHAITSDISKNLGKYILENPSPLHPGVKSTLHFFVSLLTPAYILATVLLGVYILFLSTSAKGRSRAKTMLTRMVIGMILISVSPNILDLYFGISRGVTEHILNSGKMEMTATIDTYNTVLLKTWDMSIAAIYGPGMINLGVAGATHKYKPGKLLGKTLKGLHLKAEPSRTAPMLMTIFALTIGVYGMLAFRYFMVMFFTLIFPFTIFFICFDPTKKLGGTLLEQTLLWTLLQEFYAVTIMAVGMGLIMLPDSLLSYGLGLYEFFGIDVTGLRLTISFFEIAACVSLIMGPLILFMLLRKLLPPL